MDRDDGQWFLDAVAAGEDPRIYFQSAIPYIAFLTDEARLHFLPEIMATLIEHPGSIFDIGSQIVGDAGARLGSHLSAAQRAAISEYLDALAVADTTRAYGDEIRAMRSALTDCRTDGAANGSQPVRPETNRPLSEAGSRR